MIRLRRSCCCLVLVSIVISLLQLFHYLLSAHFKNLPSHKFAGSESQDPSSFTDPSSQITADQIRAVIHQRRLTDASGEFFIVPHVMRHEAQVGQGTMLQDVTLVSQCSASQIQLVSLMAKRWSGPVSIAVFAVRDQLSLLIDLLPVILLCYPHIRRHVQFHVIFPITGSPENMSYNSSRVSSDCHDVERLLQSLKIRSRNYGQQKEAYPNNLLRNIARRYSGTEFSLVIDADMLPNDGLRQSFLNFCLRDGHCGDPRHKLVYVVPVYEIPENVSEQRIPHTTKDLLDMIDAQEARPFYIELCWKCQKVTGYKVWEESASAALLTGDDAPDQSQDQVTVLHKVGWRDAWEPFYVSDRRVPYYDERFRNYGFNRVSQVCETHVAGFDFAVLNNAFLVHLGWKRSDSFHAAKDMDQERNRMLFRQFKSSLASKYPTTDRTRSCN